MKDQTNWVVGGEVEIEVNVVGLTINNQSGQKDSRNQNVQGR